MSEPAKIEVEHKFTCENCRKMLIVSTPAGAEEAQMIAASVYGWWFEMGTNKPVCGGQCAAAWNEKRGLSPTTMVN